MAHARRARARSEVLLGSLQGEGEGRRLATSEACAHLHRRPEPDASSPSAATAGPGLRPFPLPFTGRKCRHGAALPSFFLPLREVSARELRTLSSHWRLPLAEADARALAAPAGAGHNLAAPVDKKDINALAAAFIAGMEAHNPGELQSCAASTWQRVSMDLCGDAGAVCLSMRQRFAGAALGLGAQQRPPWPASPCSSAVAVPRYPLAPCLSGSVPNILNTISKLRAFPWNELPPAPGQQQQRQQGAAQQGAAQQQQQQQDAAASAQAASAGAAGASGGPRQQLLPAVLCPICLAPLADDELPGSAELHSSGSSSEHTSGGQGAAAAAVSAGCCLSCYAQILAGCSAPIVSAGRGGATEASSVSGSSAVLAALPAVVSRRMAALAAAGQSAADAAAARASNGSASRSGCRVEQLRAQIADFLLN